MDAGSTEFVRHRLVTAGDGILPYVREAMRPPLLIGEGEPLKNNEDLLAGLNLPIEVVFGGRDGLMDSAAVAAEFSEAQIRMHPDAGHCVFFEAADAFTRIFQPSLAEKLAGRHNPAKIEFTVFRSGDFQ